MKQFKNKVAVITGAASGIGRAIAERCVQEGMKVILADIEKAGPGLDDSQVPSSFLFLMLINIYGRFLAGLSIPTLEFCPKKVLL